MSDLETDMEILKHRMQAKYNLPPVQVEQTILDFTKQKQAHSQQIRDFYENKRVIPLNLSVGYISYQLIQICEQLEYNMQARYQARDPAIVNLLNTRKKSVLRDVLEIARLSLEEYRSNALSMDLDRSGEDIAFELFVDELRENKGLECLFNLLT